MSIILILVNLQHVNPVYNNSYLTADDNHLTNYIVLCNISVHTGLHLHVFLPQLNCCSFASGLHDTVECCLKCAVSIVLSVVLRVVNTACDPF